MVYTKYCRMMLVLFRPWRTAHDLKHSDETWPAAFHRFLESPLCTDQMKCVMKNMQLLHECKNSHDDHFAQRRS
ncbi:hypothetical protein DL96DRAFT_1480503, partial [Flagelloscypha sp. PMI_526]